MSSSFISVPEFCNHCKCIDSTQNDYFLHIEDGIAYCRNAQYDRRWQNVDDFKHPCYFLQNDSIASLMLRRKFGIATAENFHYHK